MLIAFDDRMITEDNTHSTSFERMTWPFHSRITCSVSMCVIKKDPLRKPAAVAAHSHTREPPRWTSFNTLSVQVAITCTLFSLPLCTLHLVSHLPSFDCRSVRCIGWLIVYLHPQCAFISSSSLLICLASLSLSRALVTAPLKASRSPIGPQ